MHEYSVCLALLEQVERIAAEHRARRVERIVLQLGPLSGVEALSALLRRFDPELPDPLTPADVFDRLAATVPELEGLRLNELPPHGVPLAGGDGSDG